MSHIVPQQQATTSMPLPMMESQSVLSAPLQAWFGYTTSNLRLKIAIRTDERVRQMNEVIQSMQVIKMYAWEYAFADLVHKSRKSEMVVLKQTNYIRGVIMSFIMFTTRSAIFITVMSYVLYGHTITAEKVFLITSFYQILRQTMTVFFPQGIAQLAEAYVAVRRIEKFMCAEETKVGDPTPLYPDRKPRKNQNDDTQSESLTTEGYINIVQGMAKYGDVICLENINLEVLVGQLTIIVGPVGSGKTCLLNLILGELTLVRGQISVIGVISYACQDPWLFAGSVRQNILFGKKFNRMRYYSVVRACALTKDFALLPYGDHTIVGERGVSLSGGQRARINLARAIYKEADIYLLDDPLSAVDIEVGQRLFDLCILEFLKNKVVVLVTHQLQYLDKASQIVILNEGKIQATGPYSVLETSTLSFALFIQEQHAAFNENVEAQRTIDDILKSITMQSALSLAMIDKEGIKQMPEEIAEMRTSGALGGSVYREYFRAGGNWFVIAFMVSLFLLAQGCASGGDYFLSYWYFGTGTVPKTDYMRSLSCRVNLEETGRYSNEPGFHSSNLNRESCIIIYTVIIVSTMVVALVRSIVFFSVCMRASINLHDLMFNSIIQSTMRFFDTNTSGRILNRFSKDLGAIDEYLPNAMIDSFQILLNLVGAVAVIGFVRPLLLIPTAVMCVLFYFLRKFYLRTSRSVKRLEGITRSPVFGHLTASLQGLPTIRTNEAERNLVYEFDKYQDVHSGAWFIYLYTSRAFGLWLDLICTIFIGIVTFSFFFFAEDITGSEVGLAITQCIGLSGLFQWGLRQSAELENQMTSVERVLEFTRTEHEPELESKPDKKPPPNWPQFGHVTFQNAEMRYSKTEPPVLKSITFEIMPQEKVGIVGRTGAGKSSLIAALFRLAYFEGKVIIDDIDTSEIGLHDLRRKISIIPQEPVIFSGTLRYNLDPFDEYDDQKMVDALVVVKIKSAIAEGAGCLDHLMSEGGTNLSVGQRQMVCLARALLRNNIVLVMDEATANVDPETDKFIQRTIRAKFAHCTVITIAHRLHTIMDSDKVLVMDSGKIAEFDHPYLLLQRRGGHLYEMVEKTGTSMSENLRKMAENSYKLKQESEQRSRRSVDEEQNEEEINRPN